MRKIGTLGFITLYIHFLGSKCLTNATIHTFSSDNLVRKRYMQWLYLKVDILQCVNLRYFGLTVDDEWNITFITHDTWVMVATPVAQALGWITSENKIRHSKLSGLKILFKRQSYIGERTVCTTAKFFDHTFRYIPYTFKCFSLSL